MKRNRINLFLILIIISLCMFCQSPVNYMSIKLKNGLRVYLVQKESPITSVVFRLKCSEIHEEPQLAALTNKMLLKGSEIRSGYQIFQEIESLGGILGTEENKTSNLVYLTAPSQNFIECFKIYNECLCQPAFDNDLAAISELKKINQSAEHILYSKRLNKQQEDALQQNLFQNSDLQKLSRSTQSSYTQAELTTFYEKYYNPSNAVMCIVGDFNKSELNSVIKSYWEAKEFDKSSAIQLNLGTVSTEPKYLKDGSAKYDRIFIGYRAPEAYGKYFYEFCTLRRALASGPNSIFYQILNNKSDFHYEPLSFYYYEVDYGYFVISIETLPDQSDEILAIVLNKMNDIRNNGISSNYFKIAKRKAISDISNYFQYTIKNAYMLSLATMSDHHNFYRFPPYSELKELTLPMVNKAANAVLENPVILIYTN